MGRILIEVVARPVKVYGQEENRIYSILLSIGLALHEQHLLRQSIRSVSLLWIPIP